MHFPIMMIAITVTFPYTQVAFGRAFSSEFKSPPRRQTKTLFRFSRLENVVPYLLIQSNFVYVDNLLQVFPLQINSPYDKSEQGAQEMTPSDVLRDTVVFPVPIFEG